MLSGLLLAGSTGYVDRFVGRNSELDSITAALLGGAQFTGGEGSFLGGAIGSLLLASLFTLIVLLGWPAELQLVTKGSVLVVALGDAGHPPPQRGQVRPLQIPATAIRRPVPATVHQSRFRNENP